MIGFTDIFWFYYDFYMFSGKSSYYIKQMLIPFKYCLQDVCSFLCTMLLDIYKSPLIVKELTNIYAG